MSDKIKNAETPPSLPTQSESYAIRLVAEQSRLWKKLLDAQAPYRWNIRRLSPGFTLDIGCGPGRNLAHLMGRGVGIDHNSHSVAAAKARGLQAFTPEDFRLSPFNIAASFDSVLLSHVVEHMTEQEAIKLLSEHLYLLKPQGRVIFITPQEYGYRSDATHVQFMDFEALRNVAQKSDLVVVNEYSFPFPRFFGRFFKHNEFVSVCKKASAIAEGR